MPFDRKQILKQLKRQIKINKHIIGVAIGSGISARYVVKGGADIILVINAGKFRQMGVSSTACMLPFANSNSLVMQFGSKEIIPLVREVPVIFGLCATDPNLKLNSFLDEIKNNGFSGINNFPTVGLIDGLFREALEEQGISFDKEVEAIRIAREKDIFTVAFVFDKYQAEKMAEAGADIICAHLGFTEGGLLGVKKVKSLQTAVEIVNDIFSKVISINKDIIRVIYAGPVQTPLDVKYLYDNTEAMGYFGGSTFERIPIEEALVNTTRRFKNITDDEDRFTIEILDGVKKHYDYVEFIKEYIDRHYKEKISLDELASVIYISRTYLSSLFKREVGVTFPQYLTKFRINKAIELMKYKGFRINEVSAMVGYNDPAYFNKTFKRAVGTTPYNYIMRIKKGLK